MTLLIWSYRVEERSVSPADVCVCANHLHAVTGITGFEGAHVARDDTRGRLHLEADTGRVDGALVEDARGDECFVGGGPRGAERGLAALAGNPQDPRVVGAVEEHRRRLPTVVVDEDFWFLQPLGHARSVELSATDQADCQNGEETSHGVWLARWVCRAAMPARIASIAAATAGTAATLSQSGALSTMVFAPLVMSPVSAL